MVRDDIQGCYFGYPNGNGTESEADDFQPTILQKMKALKGLVIKQKINQLCKIKRCFCVPGYITRVKVFTTSFL